MSEQDELDQLQNNEDADKLKSLLHEDEKVERIVVCFHQDSDGVLAATNKRIIFADQRFITSKVVEFTYDEIAAVVYSPQIVTQYMTLVHSLEPFTVTKVDIKQAQHFVDYIEPLIGGNYSIIGKHNRVFRHNEDQLRLEDSPNMSAEIG